MFRVLGLHSSDGFSDAGKMSTSRENYFSECGVPKFLVAVFDRAVCSLLNPALSGNMTPDGTESTELRGHDFKLCKPQVNLDVRK